MFTEADLNALLEVFLRRGQAINEEYLIRMGEQIREIGQLIPSSVNRLVQMRRMNGNIDAAKREIARLAAVSAEDLEKILAAAAQSSADFVAERFNNGGRIDVLKNAPLKQMLLSQYRVTLGEMANLSQTTVQSAGYRRAVDRAIQAVQSGMEDYNTATRRALREAAGEGLRVVYPSGRTKNLYSAVRQNLLDGVRSLNNDVLSQVGEQFGANGVEISAHALCAEDHLPYQGRQFARKDFERLQSLLPRPFGMWNCKHSVHPIILGISEPAYSAAELEAYKRNSREEITIGDATHTRYEWTQQQRYLETAVRAEKNVAVAAQAAGNDRLRRDSQRAINSLMAKYDEITEKAGLTPQLERMRVEGFKAVKISNTADSDRENDIFGIFKRNQGNPGKKNKETVKERLEKVVDVRYNSGTDIAKLAYDKYIPKGGAVENGKYKGTAYYSPSKNKVFMDFREDIKNQRTPGTTWFHEHGHYLDAAAAVNGIRPSANLGFIQAIAHDIVSRESQVKKDMKFRRIGSARAAIGKELMGKGDVTSFVQDIYGGLHGGFYPCARWGHRQEYWKKDRNVKLAKESFAHFFEASFSPDKIKLAQEYFPTAWTEFEKILKGLIV